MIGEILQKSFYNAWRKWFIQNYLSSARQKKTPIMIINDIVTHLSITTKTFLFSKPRMKQKHNSLGDEKD
jgi:hypothetical protein